MKVNELIETLQRKSDEMGIGAYDVIWMNLNTQEPADVDAIVIDPNSETILVTSC